MPRPMLPVVVPMLILVCVASGCTSKVWVMDPPQCDLSRYDSIAIVRFQGNDESLRTYATQQFQERVLAAQPGVRLVNLSVPVDAPLTLEAAAAAASRNGIDAVFMGEIEASKVTPRLNVSVSLADLAGSAEQDLTLSARLVETGSGATTWTRSDRVTITVGHAALNSRGGGHIGVSDPSGAQAQAVQQMTATLTGPFRPRYFRLRPEQVPPNYELTVIDGDPVYIPPRLSQVDTGP